MIKTLSLLSLLAFSTSAVARDWPETGGWVIAEVTGGCAMMMEYGGPGETDLIFVLRVDGTNSLAAVNYAWSTQAGQTYPLRYVLNGVAYEGGSTIGFATGGKKGFTTRMNPDFIGHLAAGRSLHIYNGDTVVDQLRLDGSAAAITVLRRCVAHVGSEVAAAERERQRWAHIPRDPFAAAPAEPSEGATPPSVTGARPAELRSGSISDDDYPSSALRAEASGTTTARFMIGTDGRVTACSITASSGNSALDSTTCSLIQRRFRFRPAQDAAGNAIPESRTQSVPWRLPQP